MGSAIGALSRVARGERLKRSCLVMGWVKPVDGNAYLKKETQKLKKHLPARIVEMIHDFAWDPRFAEEAVDEPGVVEEDMGDGTLVVMESRAFKEIAAPTVAGEAKAGGECYPVVARYKNGLRRTINLAWGSSIYVCSTGRAFEDVDVAMRCQNDFVRGVPLAELERRYPFEPIPV